MSADVSVNPRALWLRAVLFVGLVVVLSWPYAGVRTAFAEVICQLMAPLLEQTTFEGQTTVTMQPLADKSEAHAATRQPGQSGGQRGSQHGGAQANGQENIVADTALGLRLTKYAGQMQVQVSVRRDIYLPLVIFGALVVVAPLSWRRRLTTLGIGSALIALVGVGSIYLLLGNIFSGRLMLAPQLAEVYPVSETWGDVLQFLNECWLTPPGNRVIAPLLLGVLALALQLEHLRFGRSAPSAAPVLETT